MFELRHKATRLSTPNSKVSYPTYSVSLADGRPAVSVPVDLKAAEAHLSQSQRNDPKSGLRQCDVDGVVDQEMFDAFYQQGISEQVCEMLRILITLDREGLKESSCFGWLTYRWMCLTPGPARGLLAPSFVGLVSVQAIRSRAQSATSPDLDGDETAGSNGGCGEEGCGRSRGKRQGQKNQIQSHIGQGDPTIAWTSYLGSA